MHPVSLVSVTVPVKKKHRTYVVQEGDTVRSIALAHYGNPLYARAIASANQAIAPGVEITLP